MPELPREPTTAEYLHLDQMVEDLKKVIEVLKYRYGSDMSLFLAWT